MMLAGYQEAVAGKERTMIQERDEVRIVVDEMSGTVTCDDRAEGAHEPEP